MLIGAEANVCCLGCEARDIALWKGGLPNLARTSKKELPKKKNPATRAKFRRTRSFLALGIDFDCFYIKKNLHYMKRLERT
jgi:hypothetical protein